MNGSSFFNEKGAGIETEDKEHLFEREFKENTGPGHILSREILSTTGLTIIECGESG